MATNSVPQSTGAEDRAADGPRASAVDPSARARQAQVRRSLLLSAGLVVSWTLYGCSSKPKPPPVAPGSAPPAAVVVGPTVLAGTISAAANLNLSVSQRPSPLVVRLYELRTSTAFTKADFTALHQSDVATLGGELVLRDELLLQPGESRPFQRTLSPETRFIGVFGVYRDLERAVWRASAAVQPGKLHKLEIRAEGLALSLVVQP